MDPKYLLALLLIAADVAMWVLSFAMPLSETNRFRLQGGATLLLAILCGSFFGWGKTSAYAGIALWVAAIVRGLVPRTT